MIYQLDSLFLKKGLCIGFYITYKAMVYTYIKLPGKLKKNRKYILLLTNALGFVSSLDYSIWKIWCLLESDCSVTPSPS
jgi:hypothetical protein